MNDYYNLSEEDVKNRLITPAILNAGWKHEQMRMEYSIGVGRINVKGTSKNSIGKILIKFF